MNSLNIPFTACTSVEIDLDQFGVVSMDDLTDKDWEEVYNQAYDKMRNEIADWFIVDDEICEN